MSSTARCVTTPAALPPQACLLLHGPLAVLQAAQIQQGRTEVRRCQEQIAAQHLALQGLAAERDACRHSAQEASQQVKVSTPACSRHCQMQLPLSSSLCC